jgi:competence protein ComEC
MNFWHQFPFVRLITPFIFGIISAVSLGQEIHIPLFIFGVLFIIILLIVFIPNIFFSFKYRWVFGLVIFALLYLSGFELTVQKSQKFKQSHVFQLPVEKRNYIVDIIEPVSQKQNSYKVIVDIRSAETDNKRPLQNTSFAQLLRCQQNSNSSSVRTAGLNFVSSLEFEQNLKFCKGLNKWEYSRGTVILYFQKDSLSKEIKYGDRIVLNANFIETKPPQNPSEFNYKRYLENKGIYHQAYIKSGTWKILSTENCNKLLAFALSIRNNFFKILEKNNIRGNEFAVVSAILLGYDDKLDKELVKEYSGAGAMHILCVSGLHVGIVYLLLNSMLFFLKKFRYGNNIKAVVLILLIWFYAMLTGLSPSVLRASTMISFIIIGKSLNRQTNIYNSLAASAFLLLIINPFIITNVGFQLSYSAVIAIVMLQQPMYKLWIINNWLGDKMWAITTVSIAAQIGLIVIPLSGFIIYAGFLVLIFSPVHFISLVFSKILVGMVWFLNQSVKIIENLPFSTVKGISISFTEMLIIYFILISLIVFFLQKRKLFLFYALACTAVLLSIVSVKKSNHINQRKFIVYNVNKSSVYDFINGRKNCLLADSLFTDNENKFLFFVQNNWWDMGLKHNVKFDLKDTLFYQDEFPLYKRRNFIGFFDKRIVIVDKKFYCCHNTKKFEVDYLIIANNPEVKISDLVKLFNTKQIIIDSSNSYWKVNKWKKEANELNINIYSIFDLGAYVVDI